MLEEGIGDHCHERVTVKTLPGSSLKVIEAEFVPGDLSPHLVSSLTSPTIYW